MNRKWKKTLVWVLMILIFSIPLIAVAIKQQISNKDLSNEYIKNEKVNSTHLFPSRFYFCTVDIFSFTSLMVCLNSF